MLLPQCKWKLSKRNSSDSELRQPARLYATNIIAERTFMLSMSKEIAEKAKRFDLFIAPLKLGTYKILDPEKAEELFSIGYKATTAKLKHIDVKSIIT